MGIKYKLLLALILLLIAFIISVAAADDGSDDNSGDPEDVSHFNRSSFPSDFVFGAATSAYQIEGASELRGKNTWDVFIEKHPDKIDNRSNAVVAANSYHLYKDDVTLLNGLGFDAYRISLSWSRLIPTGEVKDGVNGTAVKYYDALIEEIIKKGMEPFVTIFHWDLPHRLEHEYNGFRNKTIVDYFANYAEECFKLFGQKVKYWITLNEPWSYTTMGYAYGTFPPNRCSNRGTSDTFGYRVGRFANYATADNCKYGNSGTEPYTVTHNMLLAHATVVKIYREKYQLLPDGRKGQIGITLVSQWFEPYDNSSESDKDAATRSLAFMFGWYMDPLFAGAYPLEMVTHVDDGRLPTFSSDEVKLVKGSYDFIGVNYYTGTYSQDIPCNKSEKSYLTDPCVNTTPFKDRKPIGQQTGANWLFVYPKGFHELLVHIKDEYNNPPIYVTENGVCRDDKGDRPHDKLRIIYHHGHLLKLQNAIHDKKVNVKGYFIWALIDNFEWLDGYFYDFGFIRVDYDGKKSLKRSCKDSATWFNKFLLKYNSSNGSNEAEICKHFPDPEHAN